MDGIVSIRKTGSIGIPKDIMKNHMVSSNGGYIEYIEVAYDNEGDKLALLLVDKDTDDSYKVTETNIGCKIAPKGGLKDLDIVPSVTTHYEPTVIDDSIDVDGESYDRVMMIDLTDPVGTYGD